MPSMMRWRWFIALVVILLIIGMAIDDIRIIAGGPGLSVRQVEKEDFGYYTSPASCATTEDVQLVGNALHIRMGAKSILWVVSNTGSMRPAIGDGAFIVTVPPGVCPPIKGRVIVFTHPTLKDSEGKPESYAHRIHRTGIDNDGWYALTKGDNSLINWGLDSFMVRADMIQGVVVWGTK